MAESWVRVVWATRRNVYVNGNFQEPCGRTNKPFEVETGRNTFALLTPVHEVEAEATKRIGPTTEDKPVVVRPRPVNGNGR